MESSSWDLELTSVGAWITSKGSPKIVKQSLNSSRRDGHDWVDVFEDSLLIIARVLKQQGDPRGFIEILTALHEDPQMQSIQKGFETEYSWRSEDGKIGFSIRKNYKKH